MVGCVLFLHVTYDTFPLFSTTNGTYCNNFFMFAPSQLVEQLNVNLDLFFLMKSLKNESEKQSVDAVDQSKHCQPEVASFATHFGWLLVNSPIYSFFRITSHVGGVFDDDDDDDD